MQIAVGRGQVDLAATKSLERDGYGGRIGPVLPAIRRDHCIGAQSVLVLPDDLPQVGTPDFFLALEDELHVDRRAPTVGLGDGFNALNRRQQVALHVGGPASEELSVPDRGIEGGRRPQIEWLGWLNVIVAIDQHRRLRGIHEPLPNHGRMPCRFRDQHIGHTRRSQSLGDIPGGGADIIPAIAIGADAGDAQQSEQFLQVLVLTGFEHLPPRFLRHWYRSSFLSAGEPDSGFARLVSLLPGDPTAAVPDQVMRPQSNPPALVHPCHEHHRAGP